MNEILKLLVAGEEGTARLVERLVVLEADDQAGQLGFILRGWRDAFAAFQHDEVAESVWNLQQAWAAHKAEQRVSKTA